MRFPAYWTQVSNKEKTVFANGWSDVSFDDAQANADSRLIRILNWLSGAPGRDLDRYSYEVDHVICEEVVDRICNENGDELAVVSRNAYGAIVLNAAVLMFVDIDFPVIRKRSNLFGWLFGKSAEPVQDPQQVVLSRVREWSIKHPEISLRVYRTFAGIRLMVPNRVFEPSEPRAVEMMRELGCDELYITLCKSQKCFRARMSPKPWRIGEKSPEIKFPSTIENKKSDFANWLKRYISKSKNFKVCSYLETIGDSVVLDTHGELIQLHDRLCCSDVDLPLA